MEETVQIIEDMPYATIPEFIDKLKKLRGKKESSNINSTILLLSASMIEGFVSELCYFKVDNTKYLNDFESRLAEDLKRRIIESSWSDYPQFFKIIFNLELSKCIKNEIWEAIKILFIYRNFIIHCKPIIFYTYTEKEQFVSEYSGKQKTIHEFLVKSKLATKGTAGIMTSNIADFFYQQSIQFVIQLFDKVEEKDFLLIKDLFVTKIKKYICA